VWAADDPKTILEAYAALFIREELQMDRLVMRAWIIPVWSLPTILATVPQPTRVRAPPTASFMVGLEHAP
jgi:hypothetical protein